MTTVKFKKNEQASENLMAKALDVSSDAETDEEGGEAGPPMDGMAYLKQVIKERKRIPDTVTAEIDPGSIKTPDLAQLYSEGGNRNKPKVPSKYCPSIRWQNQQVSEFSDIRLKLARHMKLLKSEQHKPLKLPDRDNEMLWCLFCFGSTSWAKISQLRREREVEEGEGEQGSEDNDNVEKGKNPRLEAVMAESNEGTDPLTRVMVSMPIHVVEQVLEYQVLWLQTTGWLPEYGPWIYSLLSRIEKPLTPDLGSVLRDLVLICSQERARLVKKSATLENQNGGSEDDIPFEAEISAFNLFICLVAKYFDQGDLADTDI